MLEMARARKSCLQFRASVLRGQRQRAKRKREQEQGNVPGKQES
jgi:hypothetical protein